MGGTKPQVVKQTNEPWKVQTPYYKDLYKQAQSAFDRTNDQWYQGETLAGPTNQQYDANWQVQQASAGMGTGVEELRNLALAQLRGDYLNPETNPYIKQTAEAAIAPVQQAFNANKLAMNDQAISQGAYGGARQDLQQNRLVDEFNKTAGNLTNDIYYKNYSDERGRQQTSNQLLDQANLLALAGPTALASAGSQLQGWDQAQLQDEMARWSRQQQAPWAGINEMANILGAGGFGSSTQTTDKGGNQFASILQGVLGGASTGASLATGIGGVAAGAGMAAFAPWMLPLAALGGLAGGL